ncbi:aminotransferase class V-fold PLP-dependent enzyme [Streptomyces sp. ODS28]|uniref:aminotransferase class V-fold PLP-dependent enzyme n=1 Tax=Streptomyces sp. ODS28 TaxID=3136688 RepID=UPI0031EFB0FB
MPVTQSLIRTEFSPEATYLNTASHGLLPARTAEALHSLMRDMTAGRIDMPAYFAVEDEARAAFARLAGVPASRVATGNAVSVHTGLVAASLPQGAEVLAAEGDFVSVLNPFAERPDLKLRTVPLERLLSSVEESTALVTVSAVQSADGRTADLAALREATRAVGARLLVDASQAMGWLPVDAADLDFMVCAGYKWLLGPRGVSYLTVSEEAQRSGALLPLHAGFTASERPWDDCYGTLAHPARDARRFDESTGFFAYVGAARSLSLLEEIGPEAIGAHDRALAARFREGLARLGHEPVPGDAAIVSVPGLDGVAGRLAEAGVVVSARDGNLRAAFHLYNTEDDVDRLLNALEG